jgi:hypothetical protein
MVQVPDVEPVVIVAVDGWVMACRGKDEAPGIRYLEVLETLA